MKNIISRQEILNSIDDTFRELESQKYALDQSAIVAITNVKGDIIYVNDLFCKISKYSEQELLGQNHRVINSGYHPKEFFIEMWKDIANGKVWKNDIKNKAKDGSYYWVATTITPYLNEQGKPHMYVSIRFDITKQKELELKLEEKLLERTKILEQISEQNKQLEDFCHIISHNLRAPLSNLSLLTDMIDATPTMVDKVIFVEKIKPTVDFLQETFDQLVDATQTRMDSSLQKDYILIEEKFNKLIDSLQGEILKLNAQITYDFSEAPEIYYPQKYINSILSNLISNSLKYHSEGQPLIHIKSYTKDGWVFLEIKDNGLGIDLKKNGDKIFKLRKTFHNHPKAKGFGLFITKTQIDSMGGRISVESEPHKGTTFIVQLCKNGQHDE